LSGRGLCDELITRPEESYRLCCVVVCDLETSRMGAPYIYDVSHLRVNHWTFSRSYFAPYCVRSSSLMTSLTPPHVLYVSCKWHSFLKIIFWHEMCLFNFLYSFHPNFFSTPEEPSKLFSQIYCVFLSDFNQVVLCRQNPSESAM